MTQGRLRRLKPDQMNDRQSRVYQAVVGGARGAGPRDFPLTASDESLLGPFNALAMAGDLGYAVQDVGQALRFKGSLRADARELAILLVARGWRCEFEWFAHRAVAQRVGLAENVIAAVGRGETPEIEDPVLVATLSVTKELLDNRTISSQVYESAEQILGQDLLVELALLVGYYSMLAGILNGFEVGLPPGATEAWSDTPS